MADEKQPITVWHVDNERRWQERVARDLRDAGYLVITTGSATEAMGMIPGAINDVRAAVLDGDLGDGDGAEIAKLIKDSLVPVIIISLAGTKKSWADVSLDKLDYDNLPENNGLLKALATLVKD